MEHGKPYNNATTTPLPLLNIPSPTSPPHYRQTYGMPNKTELHGYYSQATSQPRICLLAGKRGALVAKAISSAFHVVLSNFKPG